ncbi:MAG: hypothetical protein IJ856_04205 [Candidatus Methanomethylophilaceae archaeon]|nr:hypothetical protein [Candidatus Methanomethylophilaceae archaeon]
MVKLREQDVPEVMRDLRTSFDELWSSGSVRKVTARDRADIESALERRGRQI